MSASIINAYTVILIFAIGYLAKRFRFVEIDTARKLSYIVMYVTLPCAILSGSAGSIDLELNLFLILPLAFLISFAFPFLGFLLFHKDPNKCVYAMLNLGGFNIGNFVLPFMQSVLTTKSFIALCLFDVINAFFCFGGIYCMALWFNRKGFKTKDTINVKKILIELSKSITSYCCIISITLSAFSISIDETILHPLKVIGGANTFLCMFIVGVALNFEISLSKVSAILQMLFLRYGFATVCAVLLWFTLPFDSSVKLVLVVIVFAPITSFAPITAIRSLPQFAEDSANLNMISVMTSVVIITLINTLSSCFM